MRKTPRGPSSARGRAQGAQGRVEGSGGCGLARGTRRPRAEEVRHLVEVVLRGSRAGGLSGGCKSLALFGGAATGNETVEISVER